MDDRTCNMEPDCTYVGALPRRYSGHALIICLVTLRLLSMYVCRLQHVAVPDLVAVRHAATDPRAFWNIKIHCHPRGWPLQLCGCFSFAAFSWLTTSCQGSIFGPLIGGPLSEIYGRRPVYIAASSGFVCKLPGT